MKYSELFASTFLVFIHLSGIKGCNISGDGMNCTGWKLKDCPRVNLNVTVLILDGNDLQSLNTNSCKDWSHLTSLSVQRNKLHELPNWRLFKNLIALNLNSNFLTKISILSSSLESLDVSNNVIGVIDEPHISVPRLKSLNISHNRIDSTNMNNLIHTLYDSRNIRSLDVSYNLLDSLPINLMNFIPYRLSVMNFSGNKLGSISLDKFNNKFCQGCSLDFSNNQIVEWSPMSDMLAIGHLNLSHNRLSSIAVENLDQLDDLHGIDLSHNPLNCSCSGGSLAPFVNWMRAHSGIVDHQSQTECALPMRGANLFNVSCNNDLLTSTASIGIPTKQWIMPSMSVDAVDPWRIVVGILASALIIVIILICLWIFHLKQGYRGLNTNNSFMKQPSARSSFPLELLPCPQRRRPYMSTNSDEPPILEDNYDFNSQDTLLIICSSKDTGWVDQELASVLQIRGHIVDSIVKQLPYANFTLVIVNGNWSLKDPVLIKNVRIALSMTDYSEIRLLIRTIPNFENLTVDNSLTDFMKNMISEKCYFNYDIVPLSVLIDGLRLWLNLDM